MKFLERATAATKSLIGLGNAPGLAIKKFVEGSIPNSHTAMKEAVCEVEREFTAIHECGHLLLCLINNVEVKQAWVSHFSTSMTVSLGLPGGMIDFEDRSTIQKVIGMTMFTIKQLFRSDYINDQNFDEKNINEVLENILVFLGGEASVAAQNEEFDYREIEKDNLGTSSIGGDFMVVKNSLKKSTKFNKLESILQELFSRLVKFFKEPKVKKVMNVFIDELTEKKEISNKGESLKPLLMELLEQKGISGEEFNEILDIYQKYQDEMMAIAEQSLTQ